MHLPEEGSLLRIFIGESDRHAGKPLYEWLVLQAREQGLAGATVLRGIMGFGANTRVIQTFKIERLSEDLPIVVEIVDTKEKLEAFLELMTRTSKQAWSHSKKRKSNFIVPTKTDY